MLTDILTFAITDSLMDAIISIFLELSIDLLHYGQNDNFVFEYCLDINTVFKTEIEAPLSTIAFAFTPLA